MKKQGVFSAQSVIQFCDLLSYHIVKETQRSVAYEPKTENIGYQADR
ncbi:MAG: hypothetical protein IJ395_05100 [Clostridia bacterium]|nr:hypothetical protein [Clostridia bacterium]